VISGGKNAPKSEPQLAVSKSLSIVCEQYLASYAVGNQLDLAVHYFAMPHEESVRVAVALCRELGVEIPRIENRS